MTIGTFLLNNLEIVVAVTGGLGIVTYMVRKGRKHSGKHSNDLTSLYIKYKRHTESINKATKSTF